MISNLANILKVKKSSTLANAKKKKRREMDTTRCEDLCQGGYKCE